MKRATKNLHHLFPHYRRCLSVAQDCQTHRHSKLQLRPFDNLIPLGAQKTTQPREARDPNLRKIAVQWFLAVEVGGLTVRSIVSSVAHLERMNHRRLLLTLLFFVSAKGLHIRLLTVTHNRLVLGHLIRFPSGVTCFGWRRKLRS